MYVLLTRDSFYVVLFFYVICVFCRLVVLFRLSVPVQVIDWKDCLRNDLQCVQSGHVKQGGGGSPDEARLEQTPYPFHTQLIWRYLGIK